ncbi:MAG: NAD-dependent epimerase/dehydratase family protein [Cyanobacteria bacterium J06621_8]
MKQKKVLVTGGLGFIGRHVVDLLLARGDSVRILDLAEPANPLPEVEYIQGSIVDPALVRQSMKDVQLVFHLAAIAGLWTRNKQDFITVNQLGTRNVLEAAAENPSLEKVVHTSTESILKSYRHQEPQAQIDESVNLTLEDMPGPYCQGKFLAEQEAFAAADRGLPVVIVNPTVPLGPGDYRLTPPTRMILGFLNGDYPAFLNCTLNVIDVRDVAVGHLLAAERGKIGDRYILGNVNLELSDLLISLNKLTGLDMPQARIPYWFALTVSLIQEFIADYLTHKPPAASLTGVRLAHTPLLFDNTKAQQELGLNCRSLEESLGDAIAWYQQQNLIN